MKNYLKIYKNNILSKLVYYFDDIKKAIGETKHILQFDTEAEHNLSEVGYKYADLLNWLENKETIIVEINGIQYNLTVKAEDSLIFTAIWRTSSKIVIISNDGTVTPESETLDRAKAFSVDFNLMDLEDGNVVECDEDLYEKLFDAAYDNEDVYLQTGDPFTLRLDRLDSGLVFVLDGIAPVSTDTDYKYILYLPDDEQAWHVYVYYRSNVIKRVIRNNFSGFTSREMTDIINAINRGDNVLIEWEGTVYRYCPVSYFDVASQSGSTYLDGTDMTIFPHISFTCINGMQINASGTVIGLAVLMLNAKSGDVGYGKVAYQEL